DGRAGGPLPTPDTNQGRERINPPPLTSSSLRVNPLFRNQQHQSKSQIALIAPCTALHRPVHESRAEFNVPHRSTPRRNCEVQTEWDHLFPGLFLRPDCCPVHPHLLHSPFPYR